MLATQACQHQLLLIGCPSNWTCLWRSTCSNRSSNRNHYHGVTLLLHRPSVCMP